MFGTGIYFDKKGGKMVIGLLTATITMPESRSLKDKRAILRSLKDRILNHHNVSVAEVGRQDLWQASDLAFVTVAAETDTVQKRLSELGEILRSSPFFVLTRLETELL